MTHSDPVRTGSSAVPPSPTLGAPSPTRPDEDAVSFIEFGAAVLGSRVAITRLVGLACALVLAATLLPPRTYTSKASLMLQSGRMPSNLAGLAAQFGVAVPGSEGGANLYLYADMLRSRQILGDVVSSSFQFPTLPGGRGSLIEYFDITTSDSARATELAVRRLLDWVNVGVNREAGVVELRVKTRDPRLSAAVASRMLQVLDSFNLALRRTHAGEERRFAEQRVGEARQELYASEERLRSFLEKNRDYRNSPLLTFQHDRLARDIALRQQVLTGLAQTYEQARIEEVKDIPVISVVESPQAAGLPDSRRAAVKLMLTLVGSLTAGVLLAMLRVLSGPAPRRVPHGIERLRAEWQGALNDFRHPWRLMWSRSHRS